MSFKHPIGKIAKQYRLLRKSLPVVISNIALNEFKGNFRSQGYKDNSDAVVKWEKRKKDKDPGRGLLMKSGRLRRSLRIAPDANTARVLTNVPYAQIHNEGGTINSTVTVGAHLRKQKLVRQHQRKMNTNIPMRPFMKDTPFLEQKLRRRIETDIEKLFNQA